MDIIDFLEDEDSDKLFDAFKGSAILMIVLMVVVLLTFIFTLLLCCGVCSSKKMNNKFCVFIAWLLFLVFVVLLVAIFIFLGKTAKKTDRVLCNIYYLPSGVIDGIKDKGAQYIGLKTMKDSYTSFIGELDGLEDLSSDM